MQTNTYKFYHSPHAIEKAEETQICCKGKKIWNRRLYKYLNASVLCKIKKIRIQNSEFTSKLVKQAKYYVLNKKRIFILDNLI